MKMITNPCSFDLHHLGEMCRWIRQSRGIQVKQMAIACGVNVGAITKFESKGSTSKDTFKAYIEMLNSNGGVLRSGNGLPLNDRQSQMLYKLYEKRNNTKEQELELDAIDFQDIRSRNRSREMTKLVELLEQENRPAEILDDLWFIHALNRKLMLLFDVHPHSAFLRHWAAWHSLAAKFIVESPVLDGHKEPDEFLSTSIAFFLQNERTHQFLFSSQMRRLICGIAELEQGSSEFMEWWTRAVSFNLPYRLTSFPRTVLYKGQPIQVEARQHKRFTIDVNREYPVTYTLIVWEPIGSDAHRVFEEIQDLPGSKSPSVFYAADYDTGTFHVNTWAH